MGKIQTETDLPFWLCLSALDVRLHVSDCKTFFLNILFIYIYTVLLCAD